ncbi:MAG: tetratricopeptide (TPR) repeat protein [Crocinitomicaceae bacterium]|jgi:tetratricopeptide (TPR) repeat protein
MLRPIFLIALLFSANMCSAQNSEEELDSIAKADQLFALLFEASMTEDLDHALTLYNQGLEIDSTSFEVYSGKIVIYQKKKDFEKALTEVQKLIRLHPTDPNSYLIYGRLLDCLNDRKLANEQYTKGLDHCQIEVARPNSIQLIQKVTLLVLLDREKEAHGLLDKIVSDYPDDILVELLVKELYDFDRTKLLKEGCPE